MSIQMILRNFIQIVIDEAERNPEFAEKLQGVLASTTRVRPSSPPSVSKVRSEKSRPANRRPAAVLDPIALAAESDLALRAALAPLSIDQLKDIVADYGMDPEKLVMKWKTADRIVERIVEISTTRAHKGDAFWS